LAVVLALASSAAACGEPDDAPSARTTSSPSTATGSDDPCTWTTAAEVSAALGVPVDPPRRDPEIALCTFEFTSKTGVRSDLVIGPASLPVEAMLDDRPRREVRNLGDRATYFEARTIDEGNSILLVEFGDRTLLIGSEFLTLPAATSLAEKILDRGT
jgi:hypothetical protein